MEALDDADRRGRTVDEYPRFELQCCFDDWETPSTVTVYSTHSADRLETTWLMAAHEDAVSIEDAR